tara:strand:+ start:453 stop:728 length:276 start_codon:yes stop_codon:yes gene_type:complete
MARKITISKYQGNTDWSIEVEDKYGQLHHLGYYPAHQFVDKNKDDLTNIEGKAEEVWKNETPPDEKAELLSKAIAECIQSDIDRGVEPSLD